MFTGERICLWGRGSASGESASRGVSIRVALDPGVKGLHPGTEGVCIGVGVGCPTLHPVLTSSSGHCNGRYASYLNAFLVSIENINDLGRRKAVDEDAERECLANPYGRHRAMADLRGAEEHQCHDGVQRRRKVIQTGRLPQVLYGTVICSGK